jgi:hypothetical protein
VIAALVLVLAQASDASAFLKSHCISCHSGKEPKGELSLESLLTPDPSGKHARLWSKVAEQIDNGEMPPKDGRQPAKAEMATFRKEVAAKLDAMARARAGDPGQVVLRRLNNAEYTYTIRDLTGVALDPAREFPSDNAAGEGFTNAGDAMAMSPALLSKYLVSAKDIARHAVLLPDGIGFSPFVSQRDWTEEKLKAIRDFYARHTTTGGATAVNLQGIKFDTNSGGRLALEAYLSATVLERESIRQGKKTISQVASEQGLNPKYLGILWNALSDKDASLPLDLVRADWAKAAPGDVSGLARKVASWQQSLWRFTTVGHIGKRDGPKAWQVPANPLTTRQEFKLKLQPPANGGDVVLHIVATDAGDGPDHDVAALENPRLSAPGRPDLPLRDIRQSVARLANSRSRVIETAEACLATAASLPAKFDANHRADAARTHGAPPEMLDAWLQVLGLFSGSAQVSGHLVAKTHGVQNHDFIKGWSGPEALSVLANSSDRLVRVPGIMKPKGIAAHPSPGRRVVIGWQCPQDDSYKMAGNLRHAHTECGNGVNWSVEVRRGETQQALATGVAQGPRDIPLNQAEPMPLAKGDLVLVSIGPRDGNHSCDLTAIDFTMTGIKSGKAWDLAKDVAPDILAGNPHADSFGNAAVWHFFSVAEKQVANQPVIPAASTLAKWRSASREDRLTIAKAIGKLLKNQVGQRSDLALRQDLLAPTGPLVMAASKSALPPENSTAGPDPAIFGKAPEGIAPVNPTTLVLKAPSIIEVRIPADIAAGCEFLATGILLDPKGSVQMRVGTSRPATAEAVAPGAPIPANGRSTWSDGDKGLVFGDPILVAENSPTRERLLSGFAAFRSVFPAALCYTKIVPVDEVVTLTLYYREDDHLKRLMLTPEQSAELDRLWNELHFISHDALKLVDAFEQLWQFATQDADPSAFTPLREPIRRRAEEFRKDLVAAEPRHLEAVVALADRAWRRPLAQDEKEKLKGLYRDFRANELPHDEAIRLLLSRVLASPSFLYRLESPAKGATNSPISGIEQATRLSYFLWSSAPDEELKRLAAEGRLADKAVLAAQARRMLADPRARRLAAEFGLQWLHLYGFDKSDEKSPRHFPTFPALKGAMREEAVLFLADIFSENRSLLELVDADFTWLNGDLAKHYGIPGVNGPAWRRVDGVRQHGRGGILTLAATLSQQSGASRTSPILRGNWVSEVLLGEKLPKPPKNVPQLPEDEAGTANLTVRQLVEKHSADVRCAVCHQRVDPIGFSLEGYDAIGRSRVKDLAGRPIDTKAKLRDGTELDGIDGLRKMLSSTRRDAFIRQFCRKLLGYSLGRGTQIADEPLLDRMMKRLESEGYRFGALLEEIVTSQPFMQIRGKDAVADQ